MKLLTINLSYYNQDKQIILKHLNVWDSYPQKLKDQLTFFIIDDGSRIPLSQLINFNNYNLDIHVYRVKEDLYCNISGFRNLGAKECKTPYILILDMDIIVLHDSMSRILDLAKNNIKTNNVFKFNRITTDPKHPKNNKIHPAVCLIRKCDYWNIGGCEEDLVGNYGFTDPCFWLRAQGVINIIYMKNIYLFYLPEGESNICRDIIHNNKIFNERKMKGNWSNKFIRFEWEKVI